MEVSVVPDLLEDVAFVREAVETAGIVPTVVEDIEDVGREDLVPVWGDTGVRTASNRGIEAPLVPIETAVGLEPVDRTELSAAFRSIRHGEYRSIDRRTLTVTPPAAEPQTAIFDAYLVTDQPATISEFAIGVQDRTVAEYRADGTVVATPAGSSGYARAAGGPILGPACAGLVVITIAPYRTDPDHWVFGETPVTVTVTRDESDVVAVVDGVTVGPVEVDAGISVEWDRWYRTLRVPQSRPASQP